MLNNGTNQPVNIYNGDVQQREVIITNIDDNTMRLVNNYNKKMQLLGNNTTIEIQLDEIVLTRIDCNGCFKVPDFVTVIDTYRHKNFNITKLILGNGVTKIRRKSFENVVGLEEIMFNSKIEHIGESAFFGTSVTEVKINTTNLLIESCAFMSVGIGGYSIKSVDIQVSGVLNIGEYTFAGNNKLVSVKGLSKAICIGRGAFRQCGITELNLTDVTGYIGDRAFVYLPLKHINLERECNGSVGIFEGCLKLESINIVGNRIPERMLADCCSLKDINSDTEIDVICNEALLSCKSLCIDEKLDNVQHFGEYCLRAANIKNLNNTANDVVIGTGAFSESNIRNFEFNSVAVLGEQCFKGCNSLESIKIKHLKSFLEQDESKIPNLKSLVIEKISVKSNMELDNLRNFVAKLKLRGVSVKVACNN